MNLSKVDVYYYNDRYTTIVQGDVSEIAENECEFKFDHNDLPATDSISVHLARWDNHSSVLFKQIIKYWIDVIRVIFLTYCHDHPV